MRIAVLGIVGLITVGLFIWHFRGDRVRVARSELASRRAAQQVVADDPELWPVFNNNNVDYSDPDEVM